MSMNAAGRVGTCNASATPVVVRGCKPASAALRGQDLEKAYLPPQERIRDCGNSTGYSLTQLC